MKVAVASKERECLKLLSNMNEFLTKASENFTEGTEHLLS